MATLWIFYDFCIRQRRASPSKLMLGRTISDQCQALVFLCTVKSPPRSFLNSARDDSVDPPTGCHVLGGVFTICYMVSMLYYLIFCWDLYLTLKNPFWKSVSNSNWIHIAVIIGAAILTSLPLAFDQHFVFREDLQFCWFQHEGGITIWNLYIVYLPQFIMVLVGIIVTSLTVRRLQEYYSDTTFELKWNIMKRQSSIVGCYTADWILRSM